jgi:hypothetical protein
LADEQVVAALGERDEHRVDVVVAGNDVGRKPRVTHEEYGRRPLQGVVDLYGHHLDLGLELVEIGDERCAERLDAAAIQSVL